MDTFINFIPLGGLGVIAYFIGNISPSTIMAKKQGIDIKKRAAAMPGPRTRCGSWARKPVPSHVSWIS